MRTTFTVAQDRKLVQLALVYERRGARVSWSDVHRRMRTAQHTATELRMRLHALKTTHGAVLANFPSCFFSTGRISRQRTDAGVPRGNVDGAPSQIAATSGTAVSGRGDHASTSDTSGGCSVLQTRTSDADPGADPSGACLRSVVASGASAHTVHATIAQSSTSDASPGDTANEIRLPFTADLSGDVVSSSGSKATSPSTTVTTHDSTPLPKDARYPAQSGVISSVADFNTSGAHSASSSEVVTGGSVPDTGRTTMMQSVASSTSDGGSPSSSLTESSIEESGGLTNRSPMTADEAMRAVVSLFVSVKEADIRQESGKPHTNAGEILPAGVASWIDAIGDIDDRDIFLDVGCGLGNVLVQFALRTSVSKCYGIEVREDVLLHGLELMDKAPSLHDYCEKIGMLCADASTIRLALESPYSQATIILANHRLFEIPVKLHVEDQLGHHDCARVVILGEEVCPRHHVSCGSAFCARWQSWKVIRVPVSWALSSDIWIYRRKTKK